MRQKQLYGTYKKSTVITYVVFVTSIQFNYIFRITSVYIFHNEEKHIKKSKMINALNTIMCTLIMRRR